MQVRRKIGWGIGVVVLAVAAPAAAQERLVYHAIDADTSAIVRVFSTRQGGRIEVETPDLMLTKTVAGTRVITTMRDGLGGRDELTVTMEPKTIVVATGAGKVTASRTDRARLERARVLVAGSAVGRRAAALIGRLGLGRSTPLQPMLVTTRAFLLAASGQRHGDDLAQWARGIRQAPTPRGLVKVAFQKESDGSRTPGECWDIYAKEAIAAWMEYEDCMKDLSWWEVLDAAACAAVYDMRAIGAFAWWVKCVGLN